MNIIEFLEECIKAEEGVTYLRSHTLATKRILEFHKNWPVLIEEEPVIEEITSLQGAAFTYNQRIAWITQEQFIKTFGKEPPTAPILRILANIYRHHPDFKEEWLIDD